MGSVFVNYLNWHIIRTFVTLRRVHSLFAVVFAVFSAMVILGLVERHILFRDENPLDESGFRQRQN